MIFTIMLLICLISAETASHPDYLESKKECIDHYVNKILEL